MKKEKPKKSRPQIWMSETDDFNNLLLHIIYPCGKHEWLGFHWDADWAASTTTIEEEKQFNKDFGWKTHFLGNL